MPLITWVKTHSTRRQKKHYTSFRAGISPPPLSRKNVPQLHTPNYTSPSTPHPPSRPVSPGTTSCRSSDPAPPALSKETPSVPPCSIPQPTPPESVPSGTESWISCSESSRKGDRRSDTRLPIDSAGINSAAPCESTQKRDRVPSGGGGRNSGAIHTPPETPTASTKYSNGDDDVRHHDDNHSNRDVPILPDSDDLCTLASRKEELVELFTLHGPVYGEEWRLRSEYGKTKKQVARIAAEDIESVNEELMNEYATGGEGCNEMWTLLLEGGVDGF
ncbi:hypothetical protein HOY82DRAFT_608072 [Tuber indicum]|nr:hypothetical protein HOY82DRAFT_608072 [Tuber indicum]